MSRRPPTSSTKGDSMTLTSATSPATSRALPCSPEVAPALLRPPAPRQWGDCLKWHLWRG
eukprot:12262273-Alexandrium_andersonii.AAC.1